MIEKPLRKIDYVIFGLLALICFVTFQQGDIMHTAGCSYGYLQGHFLDFYEWDSYLYDIWPSYMPSSYLVYAIWNIPMKLFGIVTKPESKAIFPVIMWYKALPVLLYLFSGILIYKIASVIGMGSKKAKICAYVFLTTPIGFFSQFLFGQYDIFTVILVLLGIYYYLKDRRFLFILFFALSFTFKYTSLLIFIPLLLLKEKNIWKIIRDMVLSAIPFAVELLLYIPSGVFRRYVLGFNAVGYVNTSALETGGVGVSFVILSWGMICAWAYFTDAQAGRDTPSEKMTGLSEWAFYFAGLAVAVIFGLSRWHPQWLLLAVPFWVISAFLNRNTKIFLILDILMMLFYTVFVVNMWPNHVDQELFSWGIFGDYIYKYIGTKLTMRQIFVITDTDLVGSLFTVLLFVAALFKHPRYCLKDVRMNIDNCMGWIRGRFLGGMAIFLVPAFLCFSVAAVPPYVIFNAGNTPYAALEGLISRQMSQVLTANGENFARIEFQTATYDRVNDAEIVVQILEYDTQTILYETNMDCSVMRDNGWAKVETGGLAVTPGSRYEIRFFDRNGTGDNCISLYRTEKKLTKEHTDAFAVVEGKEQEYNLMVRIFE